MTYQTLEFTQAATPVFDVDLAGLGMSGEAAMSPKGALWANHARTVQSAYFEPALGDQLFLAVAAAKRWTSQVAMRLPQEFRHRIFTQLDRLHDEDEWHAGSEPLQLSSYQTFIRAFLRRAIGGQPSLALTPRGTLTGIWHEGGGRLLVEFLADDRVRYLLTQPTDGLPERAAGDTAAVRLPAVLAPFEPAKWFRAA